MISGCRRGLPNDAVDFFLPSLPLIFVGVDVVVEHCVVSREHGFNVSDDQIESFPSNFIQSTSECPNHAKSKPFFKSSPVRFSFVLKVEIRSFGISQHETVQQLGERYHDANLQARNVFFELIFHLVFFGKEFGKPFLNELVQELLDLFVFLFGDPTFDVWTPAQVIDVDEDHTCSTDGGRGGDSEILDFEDETDLRGERNSVTVEKCKDLVIIEHSVHGLNPQSIHRTVENHPSLGF
jgi:hypothetical protein